MTDARFHTVWIPLQERFYRVAYYLLEDRADTSTVEPFHTTFFQICFTIMTRLVGGLNV